MKPQVRFDSQAKPGAAKSNTAKPPADDYEDDFDLPAPKKSTMPAKGLPNTVTQKPTAPAQKGSAQPQINQKSLPTASKDDEKKVVAYDDVEATNQTNRYIIYKFMKKGFSALSAEDLACTMVNPDFTIDFRKNTGEEWASSYQFKVIERLDNCKYNLKWVTKKASGQNAGMEPFFQMIKDGDISRVVEFIRQSPHTQDEILDAVEQNSKKSPLHIAAGEGHLQMCEFLLHKGSRVDARDKLLRTPLHLACQAGHALVVKLLLESNADPYEKDNSGRTAIHYACCSTCVEQLTLLTQHGDDLVHMKDHAGRTALHYTVFNSMPRQLEMAIKLLNLGADVNALDLDRRTALHHAAESGKARMIPLLVQRGASTGTKDTLKGMTPIELAATDHIKELIIVHSTPTYKPKQDDLARGLVVDGAQMRIEKEPIDFDAPVTNKKRDPKINKKPPREDSKVQEYQQVPNQIDRRQEEFSVRDQPLGPAKAWDQTKDQYLPYNIRNYQDRLVNFLKRVQEFGVQSYQHAKKPYLFTGSWMEYVRNLDDLMLQINGAKPNEAVMKIFNILFPYDKPLPSGRGDELSLQGFYTSGQAFKEPTPEDCDPELLRQKLENETEEERNRVLQNNGVEDLRDLLDLKRQLMALESVNNMHVLTIQEKDDKIRALQDQLSKTSPNAQPGKMSQEDEQHYLSVLRENQELRNQVSMLAEQLDLSAQRLEQLTQVMQGDEQRRRREAEEVRNGGRLQEMEVKLQEVERRLMQEREKNRALRFKAGQVFLSTLEKGAPLITTTMLNQGKGPKQVDGDYFLADDEALMRLMRLIQQQGEPGLEQRLRNAGDAATDSITLSQFSQFLTRLGMLPPDILSIQRIVGFSAGAVEKMKIADIMLKILERAGKRQKTEVETLQALAREFTAKNYTLSQAFQHLDTDEGGSINAQELSNCLKAMKIEIGTRDLMNIIHLFDTNGDNRIQLTEFEQQMSKYMGGAKVTGKITTLTTQDLANSKIIPQEMHQQIVDTMKKEEKQVNELKSFGLKTSTAGLDIKARDNEIMAQIKNNTRPSEIISGELKLQFEEGVNLLKDPTKKVPYISLNISNYTAQEGKKVQTLNSRPCVKFDGTNNFNTAVRIPFIKQDRFKIDDFIQIAFFLQTSVTTVTPGDALFIGECFIKWPEVLDRNGEWITSQAPLTDELGKSPLGQVTGQVKIFAKWIPIGHADSKYDAQGNKRDGPSAIDTAKNAATGGIAIPNRKEQQVGSAGKLEVYLRMYTHPSPLDVKEKYQALVTLGSGQGGFNASVEKPVFADGTNSNIKFFDVRTLAINSDSKEGSLQVRVVRVRDGGEIATYTFKELQQRLTNPQQDYQYETVDFQVPSEPTKPGKMVMKVIYVPNGPEEEAKDGGTEPVAAPSKEAPPKQVAAPQAPPKKVQTAPPKEEEKTIPPPTAPAKSQPSFVDEDIDEEGGLDMDQNLASPTPKKHSLPNLSAPNQPSTLKKESTIIEDTEEIMIGGTIGGGTAADDAAVLDEIPEAD